jgi:hypothetical protein
MKKVILLFATILTLYGCKKEAISDSQKLTSKGWYLQTTSVFKEYAYFNDTQVSRRQNDMAKLCFLYNTHSLVIEGNVLKTTAFGGTQVTFEFVEDDILVIHAASRDFYYETTYIKQNELDSNCSN